MPELKRIALAALLLLLAGCQSAPTPAAVQPTAQLIRLDVTLATAWILPAVDTCARETGGAPLTVRLTATRAIDSAEADMLILSGAPRLDQGSPFEIGQIDAAVIVHPDNPLEELSAQALAEIFNGELRQWSEVDPALPGEDIQVWLPPPADEIREALVETLLDGDQPSRFASLAPDPAAMRSAVAADEAAIGILPAADVDKTVRVVTSPLEINLPLVAVTNTQPAGLTRDFLLCLQESIQ